MDYVLIEPNQKIVNRYYSLYEHGQAESEDSSDKRWIVPLFKGISVDIRNCFPNERERFFTKWYADDQRIYGLAKNKELYPFFKEINAIYRTRLSIKKIAEDLAEWDNLTSLTVDQFVKQCYESTGKYAYSFASKVFNFIDGEKYPILDSYVATLLEYYLKQTKSNWGTYDKYLKAYDAFRESYGLAECSYKKTDVFLWAYGKAIQKYWEMNGVLSFSSVQYDAK